MIFRRDGKNRIAKKLLENVPKNHYLPYPYQLDLLDTAYERNTIMCVSNELIKNFIVINLIREMRHDHRGSRVLYFTQEKNLPEAAGCLNRHTGLSVAQYPYQKSFVDWDFPVWSANLLQHEIVVLSPLVIPYITQHASASDVQRFLFENFYLLVISECHHVSNPKHPYSLLLGPHGALNLKPSSFSDDFLRVVCFTSALLPRGITDPEEAESRLIELERLTHCRLETASELLTMLSLGAQPKERVLQTPPSNNPPPKESFHWFVICVLQETRDFLNDVYPMVGETEQSDLNNKPSLSIQAPDSRGRMICILDYCRRAVIQCEKILTELGVWCASQIARVFVKHLIGLDCRRRRLLRNTSAKSSLSNTNPSALCEERVTRLLRFTITQLCLIARLFQTEFDTCMTLDTFKTMISPRILTLVDLLKSYKPNMNFRIEVAELPKSLALQNFANRKVRRRRCRRQLMLDDKESSRAPCSMNLLSDGFFECSDSSTDTMSSVSDQEDSYPGQLSLSSQACCRSQGSLMHMSGTKRKSKGFSSQSSLNTSTLNFRPAASFHRDTGFPLDVDPSHLVYRAVPAPNEDGSQPLQPIRLCGLILVPCQFTAYALARLIDELCVWDAELYFVKPAHLFACQPNLTSRSTAAYERAKTSDHAMNQTALKTGDEPATAVTQVTLPATQEETISKFRRGSLNLLVATQAAVNAAAGGAELPRCNLVVSLQPPQSLAEYLSSKARSKMVDHGAQVVYIVDQTQTDESTDSPQARQSNALEVLARFQKLEQLLVQRCRGYNLSSDEHDVDPDVADQIVSPFAPRGAGGSKLLFSKSISLVNQYCARLPSDYITNLTPRWRLKLVPQPSSWTLPLTGSGASCGDPGERRHARDQGLYQCLLRLPINTSVKGEISGEPMACKKLAKLSAAFKAIQALHHAGELDSRWELSTKDFDVKNRLFSENKLRPSSGFSSSADFSEVDSNFNNLSVSYNPDKSVNSLDGTGRRRQHYYRKFPDQMHNCLPQSGDPSPNYLYFIDMRLTNALPVSQNSRGRPCFRPEDEPLGFGLLTAKPLYHVPPFPIFSRSGEETIRLIEVWSPLGSVFPDSQGVRCIPFRGPSLSEDQLAQLIQFHRTVFQAVLRLERDTVMEFKPEKAYSQVIVVPVRKDTLDLDWHFISVVLSSCPSGSSCHLLPRRALKSGDGTSTTPTPIIKPSGRGRSSVKFRHRTAASRVIPLDQTGVFEFREQDFRNAVVMPAYRNLDQPQHYYVAEIRFDLNPMSPFPSSSYSNFATYFADKYEATITTVDQPLLDVDFTAMRLNLLIPRYMNVRGHYLPCSSEAHKRDRRETLTHKQILIPELCFRHPFPASVWRKAVCLPSILYRLHSLLLTEELRRRIACETKMGRACPVLPESHDPRILFEPDMLAPDVFEPLQLVFPLQVQRAVDSSQPSETTVPQKSHAGGRRRRKRGGRGTAGPKKEKSPVKQVEDKEEEEDGELDHTEEEDENGTDMERCADSSRRTMVRLHATTSSVVKPVETDSVSKALHENVSLDMLLEETKVIELGELDFYDARENLEITDLMPVENYANMDTEYLETGSDVESVDSFEGNVRFFPSEDDYEANDQSETVVSDTLRSLPSVDNEHRPYQRPYQPGPANMLQALTLSSAGDFINLERMETIGDSFLKFVVTTHLYLRYPNAHEGKLSHMRSRVVCNSNLYRLGRAKNLPDWMISSKFDPGENWVPPGYIVHQDERLHSPHASDSSEKQDQRPVDLNIWSTDTLMDDEVLLAVKVHDESKVTPITDFPVEHWDPNAPEVLQALQRTDNIMITIQQTIPDKSIADCVEALIGCYLTARGERSALCLMRWFGIDCLPSLDAYLIPKGAPWTPPTPTILPEDPEASHLADARLAWRFDELEAKLQYNFRDPSLLIQAFTHPSYHQLRKQPITVNTDDDSLNKTFLTDTDCYQRLEFLGDAVLDYIITRFLFEDSKQHSPGVLTDLRSALVNNNIFAALAVKIGLHQYLRSSSPQLLHAIDAFVRYQKEVAKDDLDYITNEDIEIRAQNIVDPLSGEPVVSLANPVYVEPLLQAESDTVGALKAVGENGATENDDEEDSGAADALMLDVTSNCESQWQKAHVKRLTDNFITNGDSPNSQLTAPSKHSPSATPSIAGHSSPILPSESQLATVTTSNTDDVEIPKALGDIFESLAGAIFLDSNFNLNTVWAVFYPLMKERIERYTACVPKSPVRQLLELEPEGTKFERPRRTADGRISVCAHVLGKGRFYGIGRNYRLAKSLAAKRALRVLKRLQTAQSTSC